MADVIMSGDKALERIIREKERAMSDDKTRGIYNKYHVERLNDPQGKHDMCRYFVLDLDHDKFAAPALRAYAAACRAEYPTLAAELVAEFGPETPETIYLCRECGTGWRRHDDGTWSLFSAGSRPGPCCDNAPDFLTKLIPAPPAA